MNLLNAFGEYLYDLLLPKLYPYGFIIPWMKQTFQINNRLSSDKKCKPV